MKKSDNLTKISALCSAIGLPASVIAAVQGVSPDHVRWFAGFSVLSALALIYQILFVESKKRNSRLTPDEASILLSGGDSDFRRFWKLEEQCAKLDIQGKDGKEVLCHQSRSLICTAATRQFYIRVTPANGLKKVTSSYGSATIIPGAGNSEVFIDLGRIFQTGERLHLELTYEFNDMFCDDREFFKVRKYYLSNIDRVFILFPNSRPAKGLSCNIILNDSWNNKVNIFGNSRYSYINGRPVFEVSTNDLIIGQELEVEWNW